MFILYAVVRIHQPQAPNLFLPAPHDTSISCVSVSSLCLSRSSSIWPQFQNLWAHVLIQSCILSSPGACLCWAVPGQPRCCCALSPSSSDPSCSKLLKVSDCLKEAVSLSGECFLVVYFTELLSDGVRHTPPQKGARTPRASSGEESLCPPRPPSFPESRSEISPVRGAPVQEGGWGRGGCIQAARQPHPHCLGYPFTVHAPSPPPTPLVSSSPVYRFFAWKGSQLFPRGFLLL